MAFVERSAFLPTTSVKATWPSQLFAWCLLVTLLALPVLFAQSVLPRLCDASRAAIFLRSVHHLFVTPSTTETVRSKACAYVTAHPTQLVQACFVLFFDLLLWLVSILIDSTWLIDPLWTLVPVLVNYVYAHTASSFLDLKTPYANETRSSLVSMLVVLWAIRLTGSYLRRERFILGEREDWRYADMRRQCGAHRWLWWLVSFFVVNLAQHALLYLLTLPLWTLHAAVDPFSNAAEIGFPIAGFIAVLLVYFADTQLFEFMAAPAPKPLVLNQGLWRFVRHPNYLLEQMWWWSIALWAYHVSGDGHVLVGAAINTLTLCIVTYMVEERMTRRREAIGGAPLAAWQQYQAETGAFVPYWTKGALPFASLLAGSLKRKVQ